MRADLVKFWILSWLSSTERAKARLWENQVRRCSMGMRRAAASFLRFSSEQLKLYMLLLLPAGLLLLPAGL